MGQCHMRTSNKTCSYGQFDPQSGSAPFCDVTLEELKLFGMAASRANVRCLIMLNIEGASKEVGRHAYR